MANKEGREIAAAYIAEAERLEALGLYPFYSKWCRAQAAKYPDADPDLSNRGAEAHG